MHYITSLADVINEFTLHSQRSDRTGWRGCESWPFGEQHPNQERVKNKPAIDIGHPNSNNTYVAQCHLCALHTLHGNEVNKDE